MKYLHGFRWTGNEAAHELEPMETHEAQRALDVMEDLLGFLYDRFYTPTLAFIQKAGSAKEPVLSEHMDD